MNENAAIEQIWALTKQIEQAMAVGEYEEAARLAAERSPMVTSLCSPLPPDAIETLKAVVEIDSRIFALAKSEQGELTAEYTAAMQATRGVSQYERVARL